VTVESTAGFKAGDRFHYIDVQPGDEFEIVPTIHVAFRDGKAVTPKGISVRR
jgi:hypothetical protein